MPSRLRKLPYLLFATLAAVELLSGSGCGRGVPKPDYTVKESLGDKLKTVNVGFRYDMTEGDENGPLVYRIKPNYSGKVGNAMITDNYFLEDGNENVVAVVDGSLLTISKRHEVYDAAGNHKKEVSRKFGGGLLRRLGRLLFDMDGYFVKNADGDNMLEVQETWKSVLSPWLREYTLKDPEGNEIGTIRNDFSAKAILGAQTYGVELSDRSPDNVENIALAIRVIDGIEDSE